jgi:DNA-binding transcriptional MerR regulator
LELLTLQQISDRLNIPPSTVKYYRDKYKEFMPGVKSGRYMKYQPEAVEVIKFIATATTATKQQQEIKNLLSEKFALNIEQNEGEESTATTAAATATTQQQQTEISIYKGYVKDLRDEILFLRDELAYKDMILLKTIERLREAQEQSRQRRWWFW